MLETDEVDVDYFTPSTSTSLSKIFGSNSKGDILENSSLKYTPPMPPHLMTKPEETKQTQYLFAGTVLAYEWINNSYEFKGRLGFAIYNNASYGVHKMVIYDSNKTTLSSLTLLQNIEIKVNENVSISYYDNLQKFWSISTSTPYLKQILDILKNLQISLKYVPSGDSENGTVIETIDTAKANILEEDNKESDTDTSVNRKTKDSILKRMATMGQSVLPPSNTTAAQTSDSSDSYNQHSPLKHKQRSKASHKKSLTEKKVLDSDKIHELSNKNAYPIPETLQHKKSPNDHQQIIPLNTTNIIKSPVKNSSDLNNMGVFISEQRVNNTELRINMNRMSDKLDILVNKVKDLDIFDNHKLINNNSVSQFQNEITQKLLNEYEKKIKKYEDFMKSKGFDCDTLEITSQSKSDSTHGLKDTCIDEKQLHIEQLCKEKDKKIDQLQNELQFLSKKALESLNLEKSLLKEINDLKINLSMINKNANEPKKLDDTISNSTQPYYDITNKIKQIMNDTFQAISVNFDDEELYMGSKIKSIVGLVVKKTTMDSLKEC